MMKIKKTKTLRGYASPQVNYFAFKAECGFQVSSQDIQDLKEEQWTWE